MAKKSRKKHSLPYAVVEGLAKVRGTAEKIHPAINPVGLPEPEQSREKAEIEFKVEGMIVRKEYDNLCTMPTKVVLRLGEEIVAVIHLIK